MARPGRDLGVILGIDTATRSAAIGLAGEGQTFAEDHLEGSGLRTRGLLGAIDGLLRGAGAATSDLEGVAVGVGPGSFTGLRVGIAAAQGIALGLGIPLVGVATLECVARNAPAEAHTVCVLVDAGRGEVFVGKFVNAGAAGLVMSGSARVLTPGQAAESIPVGAIVLGDGWLRYRGAFDRLLGATIHTLDEERSRIRGTVVATLGATRLAEAPAHAGTLIEPVYVRAPDAKLYDPPPEVRAGASQASRG